MDFTKAIASIVPASTGKLQMAMDRQQRLTKPPGALGRMEEIANKYAALAGAFPPEVPGSPMVFVFASDHGILEEGVSPWPQEVTVQMVSNFISGGAAINAIAKQVGAAVQVIDIGVAASTAHLQGVIDKKVRPGTANLAAGPAMTQEEAMLALQAGFDVALAAVESGCDLLVTGDMGIGNTSPSAGLISWYVNSNVADTTGRGTGIDDDRLARKIRAIESGLARLGKSSPSGPVDVLSAIGGLDIAGIAGLILGGAFCAKGVVLDGVIAAAAAVVAYQFTPNIVDYLFAGHLSCEPGAKKALDYLQLKPILDLGLRLGEGTGGCMSVPIIQASVRTLAEMATFDSAGVSEA